MITRIFTNSFWGNSKDEHQEKIRRTLRVLQDKGKVVTQIREIETRRFMIGDYITDIIYESPELLAKETE